MAIISKVSSKEAKMASLGSHEIKPYKKLPVDNSFNMQLPVITNPIDPKRISKEPKSCLTKSSVVKAGLVFAGTLGAYYLSKITGIFSYFGWVAKKAKDVDSGELIKVKNRVNALNVRTNLETTKQVNNPSINQIAQTYKDTDSTVKFEEIKVKNFKDLPEVKEESVKNKRSSFRRSINIQNPIPNQNATFGELFELTIDGTSVFSSSSAIFLEATNIPGWLTSSNPNLIFKGSYNVITYFNKITLFGNYMYAVGSGLQIIDISDPVNPILKGSYNVPNSASDVTISENYAYVTYYGSGLLIIDISDPLNPTFKGSCDTPYQANGVAVSGNYAYVADGFLSGLQIVDITDPSNPILKSSYDTPSTAYKVAVSGDYAYVADYYSGLLIMDITNSSNPIFKGAYNTPGGAYEVSLYKNHAYVADLDGGLQIVDISDPSNPIFKSSYDMANAHGVSISGNYAYVANCCDSCGLLIIDISNPSNPTLKDSFDDIYYAVEVAVSENYVYMGSEGGLLWIMVLNSNKLMLSGTPSSVGIYSIDIKACNEAEECVTDSFDITVGGNNAPIIAKPFQNQVAIINVLFNYIFPVDTFIDPDGHSLTYSAKLLDDSPLPDWLNFDSLQRKFSGIPNTFTTHFIKVTASDDYGGNISNGFNIQVINNEPRIAKPLQNQIATINALFNYVFSTDTFIDPDGHSLSYSAKLSDDSPLPDWLSFNSLQRKFSGTPNTFTTHSIKVTASDNYGGSISNGFNIQVINNAPIIANPLQNQTATINVLFNYIFPANTFIDPDGDSLTYIALSDNEPLPSWLGFNSLQGKFHGIPDEIATYPIKVTARDKYGGSVSSVFNLIVKDSSGETYLSTVIIISSMSVTVCIACIAAFCLPLIIGIGILYRNKILRNESKISAREQHKQKAYQKPKATIPSEDTQNVSMTSKYKKDEKPLPYKASMCSKEKKEIEALSYEASKVLKGEVELDELLYRSMVHEHEEVQS
jgi:hypothetical protein